MVLCEVEKVPSKLIVISVAGEWEHLVGGDLLEGCPRVDWKVSAVKSAAVFWRRYFLKFGEKLEGLDADVGQYYIHQFHCRSS